MIPDYKQEFTLDGACYLNCAYMRPVPQRAILAGREGISREAAPYKLRTEHFFSHLNAIREQFAHIVGATRPDSIAFAPLPFPTDGQQLQRTSETVQGVLSEYKTAA